MPLTLFATIKKLLLNKDPALCSIFFLFQSIKSFGPMVPIAPFLSMVNLFARLFNHSLQLTPLLLHLHLPSRILLLEWQINSVLPSSYSFFLNKHIFFLHFLLLFSFYLCARPWQLHFTNLHFSRRIQ